ncbi:DapH/DapD/GlmU-related protein [uncultured Imperialibacter sp.]|uniref:DapH/DapD/GlmU-related protein n=1 Tax=uncultured Imperialibacter sp. TaxID=1672639 RepID=UPI0030D844E2|tara:strand:+ start:113124 stop:114692 length:1569 start_codon:yes stop_codon:yes gene_type:complete
METAPIVLFAYNRPWHTEQTLEALSKNELALESKLFIYADGPKENISIEDLSKIEQTRRILNKKKWCKEVYIKESDTNKGLADSIVAGVTEVVNKYGKVIVLEDDIVTSAGFLKYMNDALRLYEKDKDVMHISGYMYPHDETLPETFFFNVPLCWGWGTWKRAWVNFNGNSAYLWKEIALKRGWDSFNKVGGDYLQKQLAGNITGTMKTWFIKWHASLYLLDGMSLYPNRSLVQNIGFDRTGEHKESNNFAYKVELSNGVRVDRISLKEDEKAKEIILTFYKNTYYSSKPSQARYISWFNKLIPYRKRIKIILDLLKSKSQEKGTVKKSYLGKSVKIYPGTEIYNSIVGNYSYVAHNSFINNTVIQKFCSIGPNFMCGRGIHPIYGISTSPMFYSTMKQNGVSLTKANKVDEFKTTTIGNDVFIGANATVLDGITIGDGAVIGAGAVVSKDIPAYAIALGNPIQIKGYRFSDDIIGALLSVKWWDKEEASLQVLERDFHDVKKVIEFFNQNEKSDFRDIGAS